MNLVLGFDFETTGLDPKVDRVIEIGAVLWDWERKKPLLLLSEMCWDESYPEISAGAFEKHGITPQDLKDYAKPPRDVFADFNTMMLRADALMGHNAAVFDVNMYKEEGARLGFTYTLPPMIDTLVDIPYDPKKHISKKLEHLAGSHGFLNPFKHRALSDVLTMLRIASNYDLNFILSEMQAPKVTIIAEVDFDHKDLAKERGFLWNPAPKPLKGGTWEKTVKEVDLPKEAEAPFNIYKKKVAA